MRENIGIYRGKMKIDITPIVDKVLDGTEYAGLTLREWIAEIENAVCGGCEIT